MSLYSDPNPTAPRTEFFAYADIKHITHALTFLKPGGRLVALCANGPRQYAALQPLADQWTPLPAGSFKSQGTNVNVTLAVFSREPEPASAPEPIAQEETRCPRTEMQPNLFTSQLPLF